MLARSISLVFPLLASGAVFGQYRFVASAGPIYSLAEQYDWKGSLRAEIDPGLSGACATAGVRLPWPTDKWQRKGLWTGLGLHYASFSLQERLRGADDLILTDVTVGMASARLHIGPWWTLDRAGNWWFSIGPSASFLLASSQKGTVTRFIDGNATGGAEEVNGSANELLPTAMFGVQCQVHWSKPLTDKFTLDVSATIDRSFSSPVMDVGALHLWNLGLTGGISWTLLAKAQP
jgi:hypothetical protein